MSLARKRLCIGLLLLVFAAWPLVHFYVAQRFFVSPWRMFGWAMYCVPVYEPEIELSTAVASGTVPISFPIDNPEHTGTYKRFLAARPQLGTLLGTEDLAHIVFETYPDLDNLSIRIIQPVYHFESDSIRHAYFENLFERSSANHSASEHRQP